MWGHNDGDCIPPISMVDNTLQKHTKMEDVTACGLPIRLEDLLLPVQAQNISETLTALKKSTLSIRNRLQSILTDAIFVESMQVEHGLPLIANERCGSWYVPPERKAASAYFKSTDGHYGQWSFSPRRLNMHLLPLIEARSG